MIFKGRTIRYSDDPVVSVIISRAITVAVRSIGHIVTVTKQEEDLKIVHRIDSKTRLIRVLPAAGHVYFKDPLYTCSEAC